MIKPQRLEKGDVIGIVSPSGSVSHIKKRVNIGIQVLQKMGFKTELGKNALKQRGYMAGTDEERANDLIEMFEDKRIKAIFTTIGGDAAPRLLDKIDYRSIKRNPKIFLGLSDITILLNAINKKTKLVTFHGPSVWRIRENENYSKEYLLRALCNKNPIGYINPIKKRTIIRKGEAEGILVGGNLECIEELAGTKYEPNFKGTIFFWEEIKEYIEDMDRHLTNLRLQGAFKGMKGMVIGHLEHCLVKGESYKKFEKMIKEVTKDYDFPILKIEEFGHTLKNATIPIGVRARINKDKFEIIEGAVQ